MDRATLRAKLPDRVRGGQSDDPGPILLGVAELEEFADRVVFTNLARTRVLAVAFIALEMVVLYVIPYPPALPAGPLAAAYEHDMRRVLHALVCLLGVVVAAVWRLRSPALVTSWYRGWERAMLVVVATLPAVLTSVHQVEAPDVELYLIGVFAVTAAYRLSPVRAALTYAAAFAALAGGCALVGAQRPGTAMPHLVNALVMTVLAFVAARTLYRKEAQDFGRQRLIERQREDLAAAHEALRAENARSEALLHNVLPVPIARRLKSDETIADRYEGATILFADIADFTPLSQRVSPEELVGLLNEVFSAFDDLADRHGLEKIKTIGDAYMVAAGLPVPRPDHARAAAHMALDMVQAMSAIGERLGIHLQLRVGMHSGPAIAGVIGKRKFIYDLWGDTVNTASRMESHGVRGEIQVTEPVYEALKDQFAFEERGVIEVKGKGPMRVYLLKAFRA